MNINLLVEIKKEYTQHLLNILSPVIFSGLTSIYDTAKKNAQHNTVLKTFQSCLKRIPDWKNDIITKESKRILDKTNSTAPFLPELVQAVFKANIKILAVDVPSNVYQELTFPTFIKNIYIECAREFWIDPYLFYQDCSAMEIKRNNIVILRIIRTCIENAIRKTLPMKLILDKYLGQSAETTKKFNHTNISQDELQNIPLLIEEMDKTEVNDTANDTIEKKSYHTSIKNSDTNSTNDKILKIIDQQDIKLSESNDKKITPVHTHRSVNSSSRRKSSSTLKRIINESVNRTQNNSTRSLSIDSKMKKHLTKNLADSDTMTYNPEDNVNNYQEIFSNSDVKPKTISENSTRVNETVNTQDKNEQRSRDRFFNNYLNI